MNTNNILFVYGTLQRGRPGHVLMRLREAEYLGEAKLYGYALYDLSYYPGIVSSPSECVLGEAYRVSDRALVTLDLYENEGTLFSRTMAPVQITGFGDQEAYVYVYNKSVEKEQKISMDHQPWKKEKIS